jgi:hypothetical protein
MGTLRGRNGFRRMLRNALSVLLLLISGCSSGGAEADLQYIKQARSVAAEWAMVNEQASQSKLTPTYVASMHHWLRQQLQTASTSLTQPDSRYGVEIKALLQQPDDVASDKLRAQVGKLKEIEDRLESA